MTKLVQPSFLFFEVMTEQPQVRIGKLMPNWMINLTDRIMQYYIDRYLNCDPAGTAARSPISALRPYSVLQDALLILYLPPLPV